MIKKLIIAFAISLILVISGSADVEVVTVVIGSKGAASPYPQVASSNNSSDETGTSHTVSLPSGIQAGDLLIAIFVCDQDPSTITWPNEGSDWHVIFEQAADNDVSLSIAWREADGGEGASISVATNESLASSHLTYRITGAIDPDTQAPEASTGATDGNGTSSTQDPDSLSPTGGSKTYLWFAVDAVDSTYTVNAYPSNYTDGEYKDSGYCVVATARIEKTASSEDPGTFTTSGADQWYAVTLAIHPAS